MRQILNTLRSRKGISMTEVIVAMAVVVIVTGAAISLVVASIQFDAKYESQTAAMNAAESAAECVRFAEDPAELHKDDKTGYLDRLGFEVDNGVYTYGNSVKCYYDSNKDAWVVTFDGEIVYEKTFTS